MQASAKQQRIALAIIIPAMLAVAIGVGVLVARREPPSRTQLRDVAAAPGSSVTAVAPRPQGRARNDAAATQPVTLVGFRDRVGQTITLDIVGETIGTIWGTDIYTDDSHLPLAAVHAAVLKPGERGFVQVTIAAGQAQYSGSTRNGVTSLDYAEWQGSFRLQPATAPVNGPILTLEDVRAPVATAPTTTPRRQPGETYTIQVVGSTAGTVWGTDIYTDDSSIPAAAVHAGLLEVGESGMLRVTVLPGRPSYSGSVRNGVTSQSYEQWPGSFSLERI